MNILSKIILGLISISLLTFLLYVTYLTNNNYSSKIPNNNNNLKLWLFELKSNDKNEFSTNETSVFSSWSIYLKKFDISNEIIFSNWNVEVNNNNNNWTSIITLNQWIYFFNLKSINSNYIIKWNWFEINNKWPGSFIINNLNPNKNLIFSLNSVLDVNLKSLKNNNNITSLDIYPHSYLIFTPLKNSFVKNSDLLRISQVFNIWYYKKPIIQNQKVEKDFLNIVNLNSDKSNDTIEKSILFTEKEYIEFLNVYKDFSKTSFFTLPWEDLIMKYSSFFINPSKKSSFHKNIIIRNLNKLLTSDKLNPEITSKILDSTRELEKIDKKWFEEIKNIITYYYEVSLKSNSNINSKINLYSLINRLNNQVFLIDFKSLISLEEIYFKYDFIWNDLFYNKISSFRKNYFNDLDINIKWENIKKYSIEDMEKVDYLLFFLENILMSADYSSKNVDTKDLIVIFDDYVKISSSFYVFNDEKVKRTWLFTNSKILNKFLDILETKYFKEKRNENWLLVLKDDENINLNDIVLLEKNINEIIKFFKNQKTVLTPDKNTKDKIVIDQYLVIEEKYKEYFSALKSYKEYIVKYDKNKTDLLTTKTVNENVDNIVLSQENAINYLNTFNWVRLDYTTIKIMDYNYCTLPTDENESKPVEIPYCYKIDNLNVDWKNISFLLHPLEKNNIDEIKIEKEAKSWSYELDEIKTIMDEKIKVASSNKDKYKFSDFLINTFWQKNITSGNNENNTVVINNELDEDPVVKIFKRNKLLWKNWDFSSVWDFLEINYNDLIVKKEINWEYWINIKKSIFNVDLWKNVTFYWNLTSNYDFSKKHSFINPVLKLIDKETGEDMIKWNYINIKWEYGVKNVSEEIKKVFEEYDEISLITESIYSTLNIDNIKINYLKNLDQLDFEFIYNWKNVNIKISAWNIVKFMYNNKSYLNDITNYSDIVKILDSIKN